MGGGYRFLDHMTDALIEAYGSTLEEAFENAGKALSDTMIDVQRVRPEREVKIQAHGDDLHSLLFNWLDKVMLLAVSEGFVMSEFAVAIRGNTGYHLQGSGWGEKLDLEKHHYKVEIKAVTYHEMQIQQESSGVTVRFLLDL
ncbi:MAG: archease [Nitrososphaera sp.]